VTAIRAWAYVLLAAADTLAGLILAWPRPTARWWAARQRDRAARLLHRAGEPGPDPTSAAARRVLPVHLLAGVPLGLLLVVVLGNIAVAAVVMTAWWAIPPDQRPRLAFDVPVDGWVTALGLGLLQLAVLGTLATVLIPTLARAQARLTLRLLAPSRAERLAHRVSTLTRTRAEVLDAHGAELRRIERDLHDGTQGRLVAVAMRLALAREAVREEPDAAVGLIDEAHGGVEAALAELRDVVRTIYPPILADRGLVGALTAVAAQASVPTRLDAEDPGRVPAAVEAVAYFMVGEALTNVAKHGRASNAAVTVRRGGDSLRVTVTDDGVGGADDSRGTGLTGIRRRVAALDGAMTVDSPAGGPTTVTVELPCDW